MGRCSCKKNSKTKQKEKITFLYHFLYKTIMPTEKTDLDKISKVFKYEDYYLVRVPQTMIDEQQLKEDEFVELSINRPPEYLLEVEKVVLDELRRLQKFPQFANKPEGEILEEIMFKFHHKEDQEKVEKPNREIRVIEKGQFDI